MNFSIIKYVVIAAVFFGSGYITSYKFGGHDKPIIKEGAIVYTTVGKDVYKMTDGEKNTDLTHFYADKPTLDIVHNSGDDYTMTAGLYLRTWSRPVTITTEKPRNMVIGSVIFNTKLSAGAMVQYYRMFGRMGFGGGIGVTLTDQFLSGGMVYQG